MDCRNKSSGNSDFQPRNHTATSDRAVPGSCSQLSSTLNHFGKNSPSSKHSNSAAGIRGLHCRTLRNGATSWLCGSMRSSSRHAATNLGSTCCTTKRSTSLWSHTPLHSISSLSSQSLDTRQPVDAANELIFRRTAGCRVASALGLPSTENHVCSQLNKDFPSPQKDSDLLDDTASDNLGVKTRSIAWSKTAAATTCCRPAKTLTQESRISTFSNGCQSLATILITLGSRCRSTAADRTALVCAASDSCEHRSKYSANRRLHRCSADRWSAISRKDCQSRLFMPRTSMPDSSFIKSKTTNSSALRPCSCSNALYSSSMELQLNAAP